MRDIKGPGLKTLQYRALQIANHYNEYNRESGHKKWDLRDYADGLVGEVGDLMKAMMAVDKKRTLEHPLGKVEHELNDILWSLLVLYYFFELDPDKSFMEAMDTLEKRVVSMKEQVKAGQPK